MLSSHQVKPNGVPKDRGVYLRMLAKGRKKGRVEGNDGVASDKRQSSVLRRSPVAEVDVRCETSSSIPC